MHGRASSAFMKRPKKEGHAAVGALASPAGVLSALLTRDRRLATPILAGLAVLSAAAIFVGWKVDIQVAATIGLWILGFGLLLYMVAFIVTDATLKRVVGWFVACFVMLLLILLLISAVLPGQTPIPPIYCMVRPWDYCGAVGQSISRTLPGIESPTKPARDDADRVTSFRLQLEDPSYEEGGARYWSWKGDRWEERYPSGKFDNFIEPNRVTLDGCPGTTAIRSTNHDMIFIPDKGCPAMIVRWRRGNGAWQYLGQMRDVV